MHMLTQKRLKYVNVVFLHDSSGSPDSLITSLYYWRITDLVPVTSMTEIPTIILLYVPFTPTSRQSAPGYEVEREKCEEENTDESSDRETIKTSRKTRSPSAPDKTNTGFGSYISLMCRR